MITYRDYYTHMSAIEQLVNAAVSHLEINTTGMTEKEVDLYYIGSYIQSLATATAPSFNVAKLSFAVDMLVALLRHADADNTNKVSFCMWMPDEVESDPELEAAWREEFVEYSRMTPPMLIGAALTVDMLESPIDLLDFCSIQFVHLAKYCVSHGIDITQAVSLV